MIGVISGYIVGVAILVYAIGLEGLEAPTWTIVGVLWCIWAELVGARRDR